MITLILKSGKQISSGKGEDVYNFWMKSMGERKPGKKGKK